jgi:hypothetical protein
VRSKKTPPIATMALAVAMGTLAGCSGVASIASPSLPVTGTGARAILGGLAWDTENRLISATRGKIRGNAEPVRQSLVTVDPGTGQIEPLDVPKPNLCGADASIQLPVVAGGVLLYDVACFPQLTDHLMSLDAGRTTATELGTIPWHPDGYADVGGGRWASSYGPDLCAFIDLLPSKLAAPTWWPITVIDDGAPFAVDAAEHGNCDSTPRAADFVGASDGTFAFLASGAARSESGFSRLDSPLNLYLFTPGNAPKRIRSGLVYAGSLTWRPDARSIACVATIDGRVGAWIIDRDGRLNFAYEGDAQAVAWSADGSQLAVLVKVGQPPDPDAESSIVLVRIPGDATT